MDEGLQAPFSDENLPKRPFDWQSSCSSEGRSEPFSHFRVTLRSPQVVCGMETVFPKAMRILLIEDHPDSRRNLRRLIEQRGHEVVACASAEEAEAELAKGKLSRF